ncbi:MAG: PhnD/SsuA/transferrin family substrate-binding protein [Sphingomonadales bacterium]|nr:PhnD/SsuA/transferrin family substrate-binding protein [Sphingomonadales bacterium]
MNNWLASLGMYDHPAQREANDALWDWIAARLGAAGVPDVPSGLERDRAPHELWPDPQLLFGQACGYPFARFHKDHLRVLAVPRYGAPHCEGTRHSSVIVARAGDARGVLEDFRGAVAAINESASNTGTNLLRHTIAEQCAPGPFFTGMVRTGSHIGSMRAVAAGEADLAAIDALTFAAADASYPGLPESLKVIAVSRKVPALPFVTALATPDAIAVLLREALLAAMAEPALAEARKALFLRGAEPVDAAVYDEVLELERFADLAGILRPEP